MLSRLKWAFVFCIFCSFSLQAAPVGAVLYRDSSSIHHSRFNVPKDAKHHFFGFLEGPAWENKYCAYRIYCDGANRNVLEFIVKFKEEPILHYFDDFRVDEHSVHDWGADCFRVGNSMGLGEFRLYQNSKWINAELGKNIDSLVVTIVDSSVEHPKVNLSFYGWNVGNGEKITASWTLFTTFEERATHCELQLIGNYTGKVVVGITDHNKTTNHPVTPIKDAAKGLLASIGKQAARLEQFTDTLLLAVCAPPSSVSEFVEDNLNYGMVLTPDANKKVTWSLAYSEKEEKTVVYRNPEWWKILFPATDISKKKSQNTIYQKKTSSSFQQTYTIHGQLLKGQNAITNSGVVVRKLADGTIFHQCNLIQ